MSTAPNPVRGLPAPPPAQDPNVNPQVPFTPAEGAMRGIAGALYGSANEDFRQSPLGQHLDEVHQRRVSEAAMHHQNATTYASILLHGQNPQTGQPLTPEERNQYKQWFDSSFNSYTDIAGMTKEAKKALQTNKAFLDQAIQMQEQGGPPAPPQFDPRMAQMLAPGMAQEQEASVATGQQERLTRRTASAKVAGEEEAHIQAYRDFIKERNLPDDINTLQQFSVATGHAFSTGMLIPHAVGQPGVKGSDILKSYPGITSTSGEPIDPNGLYSAVEIGGHMWATPSGVGAEHTSEQLAGGKEAPKTVRDNEYYGILRKLSLGQTLSPDELASKNAYEEMNPSVGLAKKRFELQVANLGLRKIQVGANYDPLLLTDKQLEAMYLPTDEQGNVIPLRSPLAPTAQARATAQTAKPVSQIIDGVINLASDPDVAKELGPISGRINDILIGKVGSAELGITDPKTADLVSQIRVLGSMAASGTLKVHFGARGGGQQYDKFKNLMDTGKMDAPTLISSLKAMRTVMDDYMGEIKTTGPGKAGRGIPAPPAGGAPATGALPPNWTP